MEFQTPRGEGAPGAWEPPSGNRPTGSPGLWAAQGCPEPPDAPFPAGCGAQAGGPCWGAGGRGAGRGGWRWAELPSTGGPVGQGTSAPCHPSWSRHPGMHCRPACPRRRPLPLPSPACSPPAPLRSRSPSPRPLSGGDPFSVLDLPGPQGCAPQSALGAHRVPRNGVPLDAAGQPSWGEQEAGCPPGPAAQVPAEGLGPSFCV